MRACAPSENAQWWARADPFHHFLVTDLLEPAAYDRVASSFDAVLHGAAGPLRLAQSQANYDAQMLGISRETAPRFAPFFSADWLKGLRTRLGLPEVRRVDGALHSTPAGGRTGWIHSDLCSAWFDESGAEDSTLLFPNRRRCEYFTGKVKSALAKPVEYVRAATAIYYLCNDGWRDGEGGETALYSSSIAGPHTSEVLVPPANNSLLVFQCSPHSYHRFIRNPGRRRNSIILWLHITVDQALCLWGDAVKRRKA
jgi:hypothetical protein